LKRVLVTCDDPVQVNEHVSQKESSSSTCLELDDPTGTEYTDRVTTISFFQRLDAANNSNAFQQAATPGKHNL
jgi:hypothetical protein